MLPASVRPGADPVEQAASAFSDPGPLVYAILPYSTSDGVATSTALGARSDRLGGFANGGEFPSLEDLPAAVNTPGWDVVRLRNLQGQPALVYRTEHEEDSDPDVTCTLVADEFIDYSWRSEVVVRQTMGTQAAGCMGLRPITLPQVHRMTARLYVGLLPVMIIYLAVVAGAALAISTVSFAMDRGMIPVYDGKAQGLSALRLAIFGAEIIFWLDLAGTGTAAAQTWGLLGAMIVGFLLSAGCTRYFFRLDQVAEDLPVKEAVKLWVFENQPTVWAVSVAAGMGGHVASVAFSGAFAMRRFSCPAGVKRRIVYTWLALPVALVTDGTCLTVTTLLLHLQTPDVVIPLSTYGAAFLSALGIATAFAVAVLAPVAEEESKHVSRLAAIFAMKRQAQWVKAQEEKALKEAEEHERRARELEEAGGVLEDRQEMDEGDEGDGEGGGILGAGVDEGGESKEAPGGARASGASGSGGRSSGRRTARIVRKVGVGARSKGLHIAPASSHRQQQPTARTGTNPFSTGRRGSRTGSKGVLSARIAPADGLTEAERELAAREDAYRMELEEEAEALGVDPATMEGQVELAKRAEEPLELDNKGGFVGLAPPVPQVKGVRPDVVRYMQKAVRAKGVYRGPATAARRVRGVTRDGTRVAFGGDTTGGGPTGTTVRAKRSRRTSGAGLREKEMAARRAAAQIAVPGMSRVKEDGGGRGRIGGRRSIVAEAREAMHAGLGLGGKESQGHYKKGVWGGDGGMQTVGGPPEPFDEETYKLPSVIHGRPSRSRGSASEVTGGQVKGGQGGPGALASAGTGAGSRGNDDSRARAGDLAQGGHMAVGMEGPRSPTPEARGAAMGLQWTEPREGTAGSTAGQGIGSKPTSGEGEGEGGEQRPRLMSQISARSYASSTGGLVPQGVAARMGLGHGFGSDHDIPGSVAAGSGMLLPESPSQRSVGSDGSDSKDGSGADDGGSKVAASGVALGGRRRGQG